MSLVNDFRSEIREAKKLRLSWQTKLIVFVVSALLAFLFASYDRLAWAMPLMITIGVLGLAILFKRKLWNRRWFWVSMTVIAALHVLMILFVPWTTNWVPALAISAVASADFCLILWILLVVGRAIEGSKLSEHERTV
jgi:hypothetical protein